MCLIIAPGADGKTALIPRDVFDHAYMSNDDGFGAMWVEDGRVQHFKGLSPSADEEYAKMVQMTTDHPSVVFHMRYKTHGATIPALSHPFRVLHKNRHGRDLFFMHNGVMSSFGNKLRYGQSDTTVFKDKILIPLLTRNPDALDDPEVFAAIEKMTAGSRLIFLDSNGKVWRTSETAWNNRYDLTLSNTYMLPTLKPTYRPTTMQDNNVTYLGSPPVDRPPSAMAPLGYPMLRKMPMQDGSRVSIWVKWVAKGFCRTQGGTLYRDDQDDGTLPTKNYIQAKDEFNALLNADTTDSAGVSRQPLAPFRNQGDDASDDDLPFNLRTPDGTDGDDVDENEDSDNTLSSSSLPASTDERLRYARLIHNTHDGNVLSRSNLLGDILSMGNLEMENFVKDDPETATTVMAELFDIVLELNSVVSLDPTCVEYSFDSDELLEKGSMENHQDSMKEMSLIRRSNLAKMTEEAAEKEKKVA